MIDFDHTDYFDEDAISEDEAWSACERFVALRGDECLIFELFGGQFADRLISRDEVVHFLVERLEAGLPVRA